MRIARSVGDNLRAAVHAAAAAMLSVPAVLSAAILLLVAAGPAQAQLGFTEFALSDSLLNSSPSTDFWIASAAPADVDADGDLDLLVAGYYVVYNESVDDLLILYRNDGPINSTTWTWTPIELDATDLYFTRADIAWADYDSDGDQDALVGAMAASVLYRNDGGTLVRTPTVLPAYREDGDFLTMDLHSISWADYDQDGDYDLLLPSVVEGFNWVPGKLLRNDGAGEGDAWVFTEAVASPLPIAPNAVSVWADQEGDGDLDLLLGNISPYGDSFLEIYRNEDGALTLADTGLAHIRYGMADWGDIDNDGDFDIVYGGNIDLPDGTGETVVRILRNDGPGVHTPIDVVHDFESPAEPWLGFSAVTWADYDSDGDADLLISGEWLGDGEIVGRAIVYGNTGGNFAPASEPLPAPVAGNAGGAFAWFDTDKDGDLDYFVAGGYYVEGGQGLIEARTQLFRNDALLNNARPSTPEGLGVEIEGDDVTFLWMPSDDDHTPEGALTYELELIPEGSGARSFRSAPAGLDPSSESVRPEPGNVSANTSWTLKNLEPGTYFWTVRAVDSAFNGSPAATGTFTLGAADAGEPVVSIRDLTLSEPRPNPAAGKVSFGLSLAREQAVTVSVHDLSGRQVALLGRGALSPGVHAFSFEGADLPSGTYFVRASSEAGTTVRRVTILR